jgi:hypothetical protein
MAQTPSRADNRSIAGTLLRVEVRALHDATPRSNATENPNATAPFVA